MKPLEPLAAGERPVDDPAELLWRQVHPDWVSEAGVPTSQAFKPAQADDDKPSVARSTKQSEEGAYRWHTETAKLKSVGTWAVTVGESTDANVRVIDDSEAEDAPPTRSAAHAYWDFRPHAKGERKAASASLLAAALRREQVYRPSA